MIPELLFVALDFFREPRRFDVLRDPHKPLPPGLTELLAAPAHCLSDDTLVDTAQALGATPEDCRACVPFFIKQVLLESGGDYYRVLGVAHSAEQAQIKEHYFYLMRLFHPDKDVSNEGWDELYAPRINEAYNTLRNAAKRRDYDATLPPDDGFNPGQIAALESSASFAPRPGASHAPPPAGSSIWRKPWLYAGLFSATVFLLVGLLLTSSNTTELTSAVAPVPEAAQQRVAEIEALAARSEASAESESVAAVEDENISTDAAKQWVASNETSDADLEALIQSRVDRATLAVLGSPRPVAKAERKAKPTLAPEMEPKPETELEPEIKRQPELEPKPKPKPEPDQDRATKIVAISPITHEPYATAAPELAVVSQTAAADVEAVAEEPIALQPLPVAAALAEKPQAEEQLPAVASAPPINEQTLDPVSVSARPLEAEVTVVAAAPVPITTSVAAVTQPEPVSDPLSDDAVEAALAMFAASYRAGDAVAFAALFSRDAQTTDASGRIAIQRLYADFFTANTVRDFGFSDVTWADASGLSRKGSATAAITTAPSAGGEPVTVEATLRFLFEAGADGQLEITRMMY